MPSASAAFTMALVLQLEDSQWWSQERLQAHQFKQLESLLSHACNNVPYYRQQLETAGFRPGDKLTATSFRSIPTLKRRAVIVSGF